jgi:hypothetical protein
VAKMNYTRPINSVYGSLKDQKMINFLDYHNKEVILTTVKDSKYAGLLVSKGGDSSKIALRNCIVLHKDGSYKAVSGTPETRKFNRSSIKNIEEKK